MEWIITTFKWYLYFFIIGIVFLPATVVLFSHFFDKGYAMAKTIGLIVSSYAIFVLGILHIIPFTQESIFFLLVILAYVNYRFFFTKAKDHLKSMNWKELLIIVFEELLFLAGLFFLTYVRGHEPSIRGLEKFMDFGFIQSILRTDYFPPLDMWLSADPSHPSGYSINYYYFGHLTGAFLIKFSGISAYVGYNLILATILAQGLAIAFSISSNLVYLLQKFALKLKKIKMIYVFIIGVLGSFLVNLGGNLHTIYIFTTGYPNENPEPFWGIFQNLQGIQDTMQTTGKGFISSMIQNSNYWYPNATRFIPFTIHEFPSYSYVVADLHGHVFDIPFVLLTLAAIVLFVFIMAQHKKEIKEERKNGFIERILKRLRLTKSVQKYILLSNRELFFSTLFGFMIAVHYMTNAFDGPIYLLLVSLIYLVIYKLDVRVLIQSFITFVAFIFFSLPFSVFFSPFASGIGVNCSPEFLVNMVKIGPFLFEKGNCQISEPWMMLVLWGFFWICFLIFGLYWYLSKDYKKHLTSIDQLVLVFFAFGTFLIIIPEFFYIKDIYPAHFRANTMFKMGYQAFIMMSIASAYTLYRIRFWESRYKYILKGIYVFFFIFVFLYPFLSFPSYYTGLTVKNTPVELNGAQWMDVSYPAQKEIIDYLNINEPNQPVILEAQGDSYTDNNVISAYTGLPTIAGWWVHEWLWRGSADVVGNRLSDISNIYESTDVALTEELLDKYNVSYVIITQQEKDKYVNLTESKFETIGKKIFESSDGFGALYKVY